MTRNCTFRSVLALLLTSFSLYALQAQVIFTENFNDQTASEANWTSGGTNDGPEVWYWENDPTVGTFGAGPFNAPTAALGFFHFNSDANGEKDHDVTLTGPSFDCSAATDVRIKFNAQYAYVNAFSQASVGVSTDGGNDWTEYPLFAGLPGNTMFNGVVNVAIPVANGQSDVRVRFRWIGNYEYTFKVDDIEVFNFVVPSHPIVFRVNASQIMVDAGGMRVAGDFTGWADELLTDEGNGVWSATFTLQEGQTYQYKFKNGPSGWESGSSACGVPDGFGGFNRTVTPTGPATLPAVCFNECGPCAAGPCDQNPDAIICDNFDTYNTTQGITVQSPADWQVWPGGADALVSTEQAASAPNSLKIFSNNPNGGPMDIILDLQNKTAGNYSLKWKMYIPTGKGGYFNIQNVAPVTNGDWNLDVFFNSADTTGNIQIGAGPNLGNFTYPKDTWFTVDFTVDLDNNILSLFINGKYVKKMAYPKNLGGINFYPLDNNALYYLDDVEYIQLPAVVFDADDCGKAVDITALLGAAPGVPQVSGIFDNTDATVAPDDPSAPACFVDGIPNIMPMINGSMWFTFTGDGNTYDIQTVPCNSTNYIDDGDTQIAIYTGSCGDFTLIECNEDLFASGEPDYRAGVTLETENGQDYYMLIDGWSTTFQGQFILATGEFCVQVTQVAGVPCSAGQVGTFTLNNNGFLCFNQNLNTLMVPDTASFVIPNQGPVFGMCWTITNQPLNPATWPGTIPGIASTVFNPEVILVSLPNNGSSFPAGTYYLTPVVVGGAALIDPAAPARIFNVDPAGGCFFVGESQAIILLPSLSPLNGTGVVTNVTVPPGNNGAIVFNPTGGFPAFIQDPSQYIYEWSGPGGFTAMTKNVSGLEPGTYTVLLSDPSGCTDPFLASFTVNTSSVPDPKVVQALQVSPNPTTGVALLDLRLDRSAEVRIEVINSIGQTVQTQHVGSVTNLQAPLQLGNLPDGAYLLRVIIDNEAAIRRIVVQK